MQTQREGKIIESERERWKRDTEAGKKKKISNLGDRAKQHKREMWRDAKKRQKNREALRNSDTPPQSPDNQNAEQPRSGSSRQHLEGKKQSRRARYKLHKEIAQLQHALTKERKLKEKYKKRLQRSVKQNESPRSKVRELYEAEQGRVLWELNEATGAIAQHTPHEQRNFYYAAVASATSAFPFMSMR
ncbi:hypothetical protein DPX16_16360 [Anabarilius grahami]|uniref:Uncharacterized protein n=1 Tax=Anabarilius grahami TaxID=495550 RepID=A0A3N0XKA1_ANAGA|nr:hypothetical protein DPX16_16360 [Anabarilius grahami]